MAFKRTTKGKTKQILLLSAMKIVLHLYWIYSNTWIHNNKSSSSSDSYAGKPKDISVVNN